MAKAEQVDRHYQAHFLHSRLGPKVLGMMLDEADFFDIAQDNEQKLQQDHCKLLLARCGIGLGLKGEDYVRALMNKKIEASIED